MIKNIIKLFKGSEPRTFEPVTIHLRPPIEVIRRRQIHALKRNRRIWEQVLINNVKFID